MEILRLTSCQRRHSYTIRPGYSGLYAFGSWILYKVSGNCPIHWLIDLVGKSSFHIQSAYLILSYAHCLSVYHHTAQKCAWPYLDSLSIDIQKLPLLQAGPVQLPQHPFIGQVLLLPVIMVALCLTHSSLLISSVCTRWQNQAQYSRCGLMNAEQEEITITPVSWLSAAGLGGCWC